MKAQLFSISTAKNLCQLLCLSLALFFNQNLGLAQWEQTASFSKTITENAWDGLQHVGSPAEMVSVATFDPMGLSHIVIHRTVGAAGATGSYTHVWEPNFPLTVQSVALDINTAGVTIGYFITGSRGAAGARQMIIIRATIDGVPTWCRYLPNMVVGGVVDYDEGGVAVERQANGDVIAIGRSKQLSTGVKRMIAARFTAAGVPVWSFRYHPPAGTGIVPAESCNGRNGLNDVVAVTGKYIDAGGIERTFACSILASTGAEQWRRYYASPNLGDEGLDIVQNPATKRYTIVGRSLVTAASGEQLWVVNIAASGAISAGNVYSMSTGNLVGRDVCLNTASTKCVIAGIRGFVNTAGVYVRRTFLCELPFTNGALPTWFNIYDGTNPDPKGSDSVNPTVVGGGSIAGYMVTTDHIPTNSGWTTYGAHTIHTDIVGMNGLADCPIFTGTLAKVTGATNATLAKTKTACTWVTFQPQWQLVPPQKAICDGIMPPPIGNGSDDRADNSSLDNSLKINENQAVQVFPNPAAAGQVVTLRFQSEQGQAASISLFDLSGKLVRQVEATTENQETRVELPTSELPSGTYLVRLQTPTGLQTARLILGKN